MNARLLLSVAAWTVGLFIVTASAQIKPPDARDTGGNEYRYPVKVTSEPGERMSLATPAFASDASDAMERRLWAIRLPHFEWVDTPLPDALDQIRAECRRLDPNPDPSTPNINVFVKTASASDPMPHVTLNIRSLPTMEALGRIAAQVGMKVKVEPYAVSLVPLSDQSEPMVTADFRLPPEALGLPTDAGWESRRDVKDFLESKGITFPPGAAVVYLPTVQKLVVRNTVRNVEVMKTLFVPAAIPTATIVPKSP